MVFLSYKFSLQYHQESFKTLCVKILLCQVLVKNDGCQASLPSFSGQLGLYVKGSVSPPLSGVHVRILAGGDSEVAQLKNGELALETTTGMDGSFVGGPLYNDITYNVEASKVWNDVNGFISIVTVTILLNKLSKMVYISY